MATSSNFKGTRTLRVEPESEESNQNEPEDSGQHLGHLQFDWNSTALTIYTLLFSLHRAEQLGRDCMALKTEKLYLALYGKCLWPLNGIQTVGGTVGRIQELGREGEGVTLEDAQTIWDGSLEDWAFCGNQEK